MLAMSNSNHTQVAVPPCSRTLHLTIPRNWSPPSSHRSRVLDCPWQRLTGLKGLDYPFCKTSWALGAMMMTPTPAAIPTWLVMFVNSLPNPPLMTTTWIMTRRLRGPQMNINQPPNLHLPLPLRPRVKIHAFRASRHTIQTIRTGERRNGRVHQISTTIIDTPDFPSPPRCLDFQKGP